MHPLGPDLSPLENLRLEAPPKEERASTPSDVRMRENTAASAATSTNRKYTYRTGEAIDVFL